MAYEKQTWANGEGGGTPLSADRLNHIEEGIEAADNAASAPVSWGSVTGKPGTFAPATHTHTLEDIPELEGVAGVIEGFNDQLDTKSDVGHSHDVTDLDGWAAVAADIADLKSRVAALEAASGGGVPA